MSFYTDARSSLDARWRGAHDGPLAWARQELRVSDNVWGDALDPGEPSEHERRQMRAER